MRKYEEEFNEEYERGYRAGRREALRDLRESDNPEDLKKKLSKIFNKYNNHYFIVKDYEDEDGYQIILKEKDSKWDSISFDCQIYKNKFKFKISISGLPSFGKSPSYSNNKFNSNVSDSNELISQAESLQDVYSDFVEKIEIAKKLIKDLKKEFPQYIK